MEKKKNEDKRIERKIPLFYLIGLNTALFLTIVAFEWQTENGGIIDLGDGLEKTQWVDEIIRIPELPKPLPPKPKPKVVIKEVLEEPIDIPEVIIDNEIPDEGIPEIIFEKLPEEPKEKEYFTLVEDMPEFPGGLEALYKFVGKKIKYPAQDRRMQIEGRVYVQFVVEKDGSLGEIEIVKGVSSTMDAETLRVANMIPKFTPGKQRGRPVRVRMTIPIYFRLK